MPTKTEHISVCVCTFKRPDLLKRLLAGLDRQRAEGLFSYSVVVADNDSMQSARKVVAEFGVTSSLPVIYCVEPEQNIALVRNKALENAKGDFVAFIDDDEFPHEDWLHNLFKACRAFEADGVLGPVQPHFEHEPPKWVVKGKFYERPTHKTGSILHWTNTRTGNVLFKREVFSGNGNMFRKEFGMGGEDKDFFRRMMSKGFRFVWCSEAPVYEVVPPHRCKRSFMLRRALLRGKIPHFSTLDIIKSIIAIPLYSASLPILFLSGHHRFMKYLIKDFDHIGRILALCGIDTIKQKYVIE
jgi:glycosyltransferase involved in cell wall biosynthesis